MSTTARIDRNVIRYECGRGRRCISIGRDDERYVVGASVSELGRSGRGRPRDGKDLGERSQNGGMRLQTEGVFGTEGGSGMTRELRISRGKPLVGRTRIIILMTVKF